jgi:hypothetical protein
MPHKRGYDTQIINGWERDRYGCIVTFADPKHRHMVTVHRAGMVTAALAECLDLVPPPWGVVCISTPNTVYGDVSGARSRNSAADNSIEGVMLARVRRPGRMHPDLWPRANPARSRYRAAYLAELRAWHERQALPSKA